MADIRDKTDTELTELGQEQARAGSTLPPDKPDTARRRRRPLWIVLGVVVGVVVYALAFQQTQVDLTEITSETRQQSLERILRDLARPDLVTYDTTEETTEAGVAIPCGPEVPTDPRLTITPSCGAPGETLSVTGTGFEPRESVELRFVPDTDFDITLRLALVNADADGNFNTGIVLPDRTSEEPQSLLAVTREPIGTWGSRVEVYTDANENGVEDDPVLGDGGTYTFTLPGDPVVPAVSLVNPAGETSEFVTTGDSFEAITGLSRGQVAIPLGEEETAAATGLAVSGVAVDDGDVAVTVEGPAGFDMSNWRAALYDGATGEPGASNYISDTINLSPRVSETAKITLDKILETVFLALVATTAGLLLAVPLSFVAARNIMRDISVTVTNLVLILIAIPLGAVLGVLAARLARTMVGPVADSGLGLFIAMVATAGLAWFLARTALPTVDTGVPTRAERLRRGLLLVGAGAVGLMALLLTSLWLQAQGSSMVSALGWFGFLGSFFAALGEILDVAFTVIAALAVGAVFAHLSSKLAYAVRKHNPPPLVRTLNVILAALAGALWAVIVGQIIDWFYQIGSVSTIVVIPAIIGAVLGVAVAMRGMAKGEVAIGLSIYYAARTVFNTLRSIEPLVMAIVFVVWVGAGPFAGSLALALHTAAALAKLYSEQVESIAAGPIEAVRATGANRLQTIVYSVVPQIVPPYISFTMYRWDINVRMSTILGFVGGGGIGSILQQNINLLQYQAAAVQMLAIAIVVASMDYASSRMREHFV
ncbi:MAG: ABC transporter permease subunit [Acidimicrobiia bacterium]